MFIFYYLNGRMEERKRSTQQKYDSHEGLELLKRNKNENPYHKPEQEVEPKLPKVKWIDLVQNLRVGLQFKLDQNIKLMCRIALKIKTNEKRRRKRILNRRRENFANLGYCSRSF